MGSNHWLGSCSMGSSASNSVVDENVKVWNTKNLFVIDASFVRFLSLNNSLTDDRLFFKLFRCRVCLWGTHMELLWLLLNKLWLGFWLCLAALKCILVWLTLFDSLLVFHDMKGNSIRMNIE